MNLSLLDRLKQRSLEEGFLDAGGVDLISAWPIYLEHLEKYDRWLAKGHLGEMHYLARGRERRANPKLLLPEVESVFCVLLPYRRTAAGQTDSTQGPRYARYLDGPDYHERVASKLETVLRHVSNSSPDLQLSWKVCVDTSAVLERAWAAISGLGWIGKNTLLVHPKHGSYHFIGVAFLSARLNVGPNLLPDYCGNCSRCLQGCPTKAFESPRVLDSRKCISYWTLEKRGDLSLSDDEQKKMGTWVAGCDICQEVCPFNFKPTRAEVNNSRQFNSNSAPNALALNTWKSLTEETTEDYRIRVRDSALSRVKPEMFKRNLQIAQKNALTNDSSE